MAGCLRQSACRQGRAGCTCQLSSGKPHRCYCCRRCFPARVPDLPYLPLYPSACCPLTPALPCAARLLPPSPPPAPTHTLPFRRPDPQTYASDAAFSFEECALLAQAQLVYTYIGVLDNKKCYGECMHACMQHCLRCLADAGACSCGARGRCWHHHHAHVCARCVAAAVLQCWEPRPAPAGTAPAWGMRAACARVTRVRVSLRA